MALLRPVNQADAYWAYLGPYIQQRDRYALLGASAAAQRKAASEALMWKAIGSIATSAASAYLGQQNLGAASSAQAMMAPPTGAAGSGLTDVGDPLSADVGPAAGIAPQGPTRWADRTAPMPLDTGGPPSDALQITPQEHQGILEDRATRARGGDGSGAGATAFLSDQPQTDQPGGAIGYAQGLTGTAPDQTREVRAALAGATTAPSKDPRAWEAALNLLPPDASLAARQVIAQRMGVAQPGGGPEALATGGPEQLAPEAAAAAAAAPIPPADVAAPAELETTAPVVQGLTQAAPTAVAGAPPAAVAAGPAPGGAAPVSAPLMLAPPQAIGGMTMGADGGTPAPPAAVAPSGPVVSAPQALAPSAAPAATPGQAAAVPTSAPPGGPALAAGAGTTNVTATEQSRGVVDATKPGNLPDAAPKPYKTGPPPPPPFRTVPQMLKDGTLTGAQRAYLVNHGADAQKMMDKEWTAYSDRLMVHAVGNLQEVAEGKQPATMAIPYMWDEVRALAAGGKGKEAMDLAKALYKMKGDEVAKQGLTAWIAEFNGRRQAGMSFDDALDYAMKHVPNGVISPHKGDGTTFSLTAPELRATLEAFRSSKEKGQEVGNQEVGKLTAPGYKEAKAAEITAEAQAKLDVATEPGNVAKEGAAKRELAKQTKIGEAQGALSPEAQQAKALEEARKISTFAGKQRERWANDPRFQLADKWAQDPSSLTAAEQRQFGLHFDKTDSRVALRALSELANGEPLTDPVMAALAAHGRKDIIEMRAKVGTGTSTWAALLGPEIAKSMGGVQGGTATPPPTPAPTLPGQAAPAQPLTPTVLRADVLEKYTKALRDPRLNTDALRREYLDREQAENRMTHAEALRLATTFKLTYP